MKKRRFIVSKGRNLLLRKQRERTIRGLTHFRNRYVWSFFLFIVFGGFHSKKFNIHVFVHDSTKYLNIPIYQDKFFRNLHDISRINITLYVKRIEKNRGFIPQNFKISANFRFPESAKPTMNYSELND